MEISEEKISMASDFIKQCLLPEFDREIGDQPLERDDFNVFVYGLSQNLRLLFDMISKNEKLLLKSVNETKEFRMNFILLLNEQTGSWNAPFQTDDLSLLKHLDTLVDQYYGRVLADKEVLEKCLAFYKERLTAAKWKRNIGAVYGYGRFCELYYEKQQSKIDVDATMFTLSVGMLLVEYFEPQYKDFGIKLFLCLTSAGTKKTLTELNVLEAIYKKLMDPLIVVVREEAGIVTLLDCLYNCVRYDGCWKSPSDWNKVDDILEKIFERIILENDRRIVSIFLLFIARVTSLPIEANGLLQNAVNFSKLESTVEANPSSNLEYDELRIFCKTNNNLLVYRWVKKLLNLFKSQTLLGWSMETRLQLNAMHRCYLICIYGIPMDLLTPDWTKFVDEIVPNLITLAKASKSVRGCEHAQLEIAEFLKTLQSQFDVSKIGLDATQAAELNALLTEFEKIEI